MLNKQEQLEKLKEHYKGETYNSLVDAFLKNMEWEVPQGFDFKEYEVNMTKKIISFSLCDQFKDEIIYALAFGQQEAKYEIKPATNEKITEEVNNEF
jgi:hypothetical protein